VCAIFSGFALPRSECRNEHTSAVKDRTKGSGFWFCCDTVEDLHGECRLGLAGEANLKTVLKAIVILMVLGALSMLASTRLDGPRGLLAGGPFQSGADAISPADWSFLEGQDTLEFQTEAPERSRTVWLVVHDNRLFLVSGYMNTFVGKLWKKWPFHIEANPNVLIRDKGKIFKQRLARLREGAIPVAVMQKFSDKYGLAAETPSDKAVLAMLAAGDTWLFEVVARKGSIDHR